MKIKLPRRVRHASFLAEALESRQLLSAAVVDDTVNAGFGVPYTVTLASDITISSLLLSSPDATINHTSGTLRLVDGGLNINSGRYRLNGGTISSDDAMTVRGRFEWNGGTLAGLGAVDVTSLGVVDLGSFSGSRTLSRTMNNRGLMLIGSSTGLQITGGTLTISPVGSSTSAVPAPLIPRARTA